MDFYVYCNHYLFKPTALWAEQKYNIYIYCYYVVQKCIKLHNITIIVLYSYLNYVYALLTLRVK